MGQLGGGLGQGVLGSAPAVGSGPGTAISPVTATAVEMALLLEAGLYAFPLRPFITPFCQTQLFLLLVYIFFCSSNDYFFWVVCGKTQDCALFSTLKV